MWDVVEPPKELLSTREAAALLGVSARRVRQLLDSGDLSGEDIDGRWIVHRSSVVDRIAQRPEPVRPLSSRRLRYMADALALGLDGEPAGSWDEAPARERRLAVQRVHDLSAAGNAAPRLRALARARIGARRILDLAVAPESVTAVPGVRRSGVSHPLSNLDPVGEVEVSASAEAFDRLAALPPGDDLRVIVHLADDWSVGDVVLDLVEHVGSREDGDAVELIARADTRLREIL